jgi:hypothetical protein
MVKQVLTCESGEVDIDLELTAEMLFLTFYHHFPIYLALPFVAEGGRGGCSDRFLEWSKPTNRGAELWNDDACCY